MPNHDNAVTDANWLPIKDAAEVLHKSIRSVWRYVNDGSLPSQKDALGHTLVDVSRMAVKPKETTIVRTEERPAATLGSERFVLQKMIADLTAERDYLRERLAEAIRAMAQPPAPPPGPRWRFWRH